ncbi:MAG: FAD:protein FMN transferase [Spirochaetaceae bacterium]|nr:FAD:protein FMN transferase [Spirochaetaceae bacterium]
MLRKFLLPGAAVLFIGLLLVVFLIRNRNIIPDSIEDNRFLLDTVVSIKLYNSVREDILDEAFSLIENYENLFSRHKKDSDISRINLAAAGTPTVVSGETGNLLTTALDYARLSEGRFDPTVGPLVQLWGIGTENPHVPDTLKIAEALPLVNYSAVTVSRETGGITLEKEGMMLDLGGIAKGWIADRIGEFLIENRETHFLINLGGNVLVHGGKPEGKAGIIPFKVGMQNPFESRGRYLGVFSLTEGSVVSSGIYERFFESGGTRYHHILNTADGYPVRNNLAAVTVLSELSIDGDALSTTLFTLGLDKGIQLVENLDGIDAAFVTMDGKVILTPGAARRYESSENE